VSTRLPPSRRLLAAAWLLAGLVELALAMGTADPPTGLQLLRELGLLAAVGLAHTSWAPQDWKGSPAWPAAALLMAVFLRVGTLSPAGQVGRFAIVVAVAVVGVRVAHDLLRRLPRAPATVVLILLAGLSARLAALQTAPVAEPFQRLGEQLAAPFHRAPAATATGPALIVLSIDTLRADRARTMHTWKRLAARGATWDQAMSTASWTLPALSSVWTGLPPAEHGAGKVAGGGFSAIRPQVPLLAEELRDQGYETAAFVVNPFVASELGLRRGFSTWSNADESPSHPLLFLGPRSPPRGRDGARGVDRALGWLAHAPDQGFLLWIHLFDPHVPYTHATDPLATDVPEITRLIERTATASPERRAALTAAYDAEVAYDDAQLQRVLDALEARGLLDRAVVVFLSDHGEELWDHGGYEHGHSHHTEVVDGSLAVVAPGLAPGPRSGVASLVDVAPTLRAAAGLPPRGLDLRQGVPPGRIATAAGNLYGEVQQSARSTRRKVILTQGAQGAQGEQVELYDPLADPTEQQPLPPEPEAPELAAARSALPATETTAAKANTEALRALGYIEP